MQEGQRLSMSNVTSFYKYIVAEWMGGGRKIEKYCLELQRIGWCEEPWLQKVEVCTRTKILSLFCSS